MATREPRARRRSAGSERPQPEHATEIGMDEAWKANMKLTYDSTLTHFNVLMAHTQQAHDQAMKSLVENQDQAMKNLVAQCQLNMTQAAENHRHGADRLWAGSDTAQGGVDVATLNAISRDDAALKAVGAAIAAAVLDALKAK